MSSWSGHKLTGTFSVWRQKYLWQFLCRQFLWQPRAVVSTQLTFSPEPDSAAKIIIIFGGCTCHFWAPFLLVLKTEERDQLQSDVWESGTTVSLKGSKAKQKVKSKQGRRVGCKLWRSLPLSQTSQLLLSSRFSAPRAEFQLASWIVIRYLSWIYEWKQSEIRAWRMPTQRVNPHTHRPPTARLTSGPK